MAGLPYIFTNVGNPEIDAAQVNADFNYVLNNATAIAVASGADLSGLGVFNVKHYGAVGDGVTDDTAAIQAAVDAAYAAGGGNVYCPNATYLVSTRHGLAPYGTTVYTCIELKKGVRIVGQSRTGTVIKLTNGVQSCIIAGNGTGTYTANDCGCENLTLDGNRANQTESALDGNQCGLFIINAARVIVRNLSAINCQRQGYYDSINTWTRLDDFYATNCGCEGFSLSNSFYGLYSNIVVDACGQNAGTQGAYHSGVYINGGAIENTVINVYTANSPSGFGFSLSSDTSSTDCINNAFVGITSVNNAGGVYIGNSAASTFVARNRFYNLVSRLDGTAAGQSAITLYQCNDSLFSGTTVYNAKIGAGVRLTKSSGNRFDNLVTFDNQGTHTQTYGIQEDVDSVNCVENIFLYPVFRGGFTTAAYTLTNSVVQGAIGANDFLRPRTPSLLNTWAVFSGETPTVSRDAGNFIRLRGMVSGGTLGQPAFTLNVGERPDHDMYLPAASNGAFGLLLVSAAGNVEPVSGSSAYFSLDGVPAYAGN